jgi:hypothetical protein
LGIWPGSCCAREGGRSMGYGWRAPGGIGFWACLCNGKDACCFQYLLSMPAHRACGPVLPYPCGFIFVRQSWLTALTQFTEHPLICSLLIIISLIRQIIYCNFA